MKGKRSDLILSYKKSRESLVRMSFVLFVVFLAIASLSRVRTGDSGFELILPFLKGFKISTGDLVVFGPLAIFILAIWFDRKFYDCLKTRKAIIKSYESDELFSEIENHLLSPPFVLQTQTTILKKFQTVLPRFIYFWAIASIVFLLIEYFKFRKHNDSNSTVWDTIVGSPPLSGFNPYWPRFEEVDVAWIYPPWYPLCYLVMVSFLIWRVCLPPAEADDAVLPKKADVTPTLNEDKVSTNTASPSPDKIRKSQPSIPQGKDKPDSKPNSS